VKVTVGTRTATRKAAMTEQPTEPVDDYPPAWKPRERRELDRANAPLELERALIEMNPRERALMLQRIQAMK
jgi:hypothetical protein